MNDAGTVIVADVYAAGEAPIAGVTATRWWTGCARAAIAAWCRCRRPDDLAEMVLAIAKPGDFVVCLGAGNITALGARAAGPSWRRCRPARRSRRRRGMMALRDTHRT